MQGVGDEGDGTEDGDGEECGAERIALTKEFSSGRVQGEQDPDRSRHDQRRDKILVVSGDCRPHEKGRDHESGSAPGGHVLSPTSRSPARHPTMQENVQPSPSNSLNPPIGLSSRRARCADLGHLGI